MVLSLNDNAVYVGIDDSARQHLLLALQAGSSPPPGIATVAIATRVLAIGGVEKAFLDLTCMFDSLAEVFDHFASAVMDHFVTTGDSVVAVTAVLERWKEFLTASPRPPGTDKLASVFGELLVLLDAVNQSHISDTGIWVGPFGARHDLRGGLTAIEVKTTRSHTSRRVTIHGEDQLLPPDGGQLYLHFVRIEQVPGASQSVASIVDALLSAGCPAEPLFTAINKAGVPATQLVASAEITFDVRERVTLLVDDNTPKITPDSFANRSRPSGVVDLSYVIDLDQCIQSSLPHGAYNELVKEIAEQGGLK